MPRKPVKLPTVSVIIPAYNCRASLPETLASVAAQTLKPLEILICDDGSRDGTWEYLESLGTSYKGIPLKVFRQQNAGAGAARNRCLKVAKGELVTFLDADDQWLPTKLQRSAQVLVAGNYTFVAHDFYAVDTAGNRTLWHCAANAKRRDWLNKGDIQTHYFYRGFIGILTVLMRRDAVVKAGGFHGQERYGLDWECWHAIFASQPDTTFTVFDELLALYALSPAGLTSKAMLRMQERERHLARYVKFAAGRAHVWWPILFTRAWLTLQYEAASVYLRTHQPFNLLKVILRAPFAWMYWVGKVAMAKPYVRPDFLKRKV